MEMVAGDEEKYDKMQQMVQKNLCRITIAPKMYFQGRTAINTKKCP